MYLYIFIERNLGEGAGGWIRITCMALKIRTLTSTNQFILYAKTEANATCENSVMW